VDSVLLLRYRGGFGATSAIGGFGVAAPVSAGFGVIRRLADSALLQFLDHSEPHLYQVDSVLLPQFLEVSERHLVDLVQQRLPLVFLRSNLHSAPPLKTSALGHTSTPYDFSLLTMRQQRPPAFGTSTATSTFGIARLYPTPHLGPQYPTAAASLVVLVLQHLALFPTSFRAPRSNSFSQSSFPAHQPTSQIVDTLRYIYERVWK
jgi:hypothetical protein